MHWFYTFINIYISDVYILYFMIVDRLIMFIACGSDEVFFSFFFLTRLLVVCFIYWLYSISLFQYAVL